MTSPEVTKNVSDLTYQQKARTIAETVLQAFVTNLRFSPKTPSSTNEAELTWVRSNPSLARAWHIKGVKFGGKITLFESASLSEACLILSYLSEMVKMTIIYADTDRMEIFEADVAGLLASLENELQAKNNEIRSRYAPLREALSLTTSNHGRAALLARIPGERCRGSAHCC
jgi:hypothetical protein